MFEPRDAPYPELKKRHTMPRTGRPYSRLQAARRGAGVGRDRGARSLPRAARGDRARRVRRAARRRAVDRRRCARRAARCVGAAPRVVARRCHRARAARQGPRRLRAQRHRQALPRQRRPGLHGRSDRGRPRPARQLDPARRHGAPRQPSTPIEDDPEAFYVPLVEGTFTTMWRTATRADLKMRLLHHAGRAHPRPRRRRRAVGDRDARPPARRGPPSSTTSPGVLDVARRKTAEFGVADRCEFRPGDYFEIDVEPGAYDIVVLGHICRAEGAGRRAAADRPAFDALKPGGRRRARRLLPGPREEAQPARRADGRHDDGGHHERVHVHARRVRSGGCAPPGSPTSA